MRSLTDKARPPIFSTSQTIRRQRTKEISTTTIILTPNSELSSGSDLEDDDGDSGGIDGPGGEKADEFGPEPKPERGRGRLRGVVDEKPIGVPEEYRGGLQRWC